MRFFKAASSLVPLGWFARAITANTTFDLNGGTATSITGARYVFPIAGELRAVSYDMLTAITTGTLTLEVWKNGSSASTTTAVVNASGARGVWTLATPVLFNAGDALHFKGVATAGTFPTSIVIMPLVSLS